MQAINLVALPSFCGPMKPDLSFPQKVLDLASAQLVASLLGGGWRFFVTATESARVPSRYPRNMGVFPAQARRSDVKSKAFLNL
jgi:hypothetical protein